MKAQIPIIIALVVLAALIISTLAFTSTLAITQQTSQQIKSNTYWEIINNDLDTLDLVALKYTSNKAYTAFINTFNSTYTGGVTIKQLKLVSRSAIWWTNFSTDPIKNGILIPVSGLWRTYTTRNYLLLISTWRSTYTTGGEGIALLNLTKLGLSSSNFRKIYIVAVIENPTTYYPDYSDMIVNVSSNSFYTIGIDNNPYHLNYYLDLVAWIYNGTTDSWSLISANNTSFTSTIGTYITSVLEYNKLSNSFELMAFDNSTQEWNYLKFNDTLNKTYDLFGIGGTIFTTSYYIHLSYEYYYYLVVSIDRDPRYVYFTGLEPGWKVTLYNYNNPYRYVYTGVANSTGVATIMIPSCVLYNSFIEIIDGSGNLVFNTTIPVIVGGDIWEYIVTVGIPSTPSPYNYTLALDSFVSALNKASQSAVSVLRDGVLRIIDNWIGWMRQEGYVVTYRDFNPVYNVSIYNDGYLSIGNGTVGFSIVYDVLSPTGDFMSFKKSIFAHYIMILDQGYPYGTKYMAIPITISTDITINGKKYSYLVSPDQLDITIKSELFVWLPSFSTYTGATPYYHLAPVATSYYGKGLANVTYLLPYGYTGTIATVDLYNDAVDILYPYYGSNGTFLWATTSSITVDGIKVPSALKIVFIYSYDSSTNTLKVRLYGTANRPITPLT